MIKPLADSQCPTNPQPLPTNPNPFAALDDANLEDGELLKHVSCQGNFAIDLDASVVDIAEGTAPGVATVDFDSLEGDSSFTPVLWGHKIKMVDELDRKKKKNSKKNSLKKKKRYSGGSKGAEGSKPTSY